MQSFSFSLSLAKPEEEEAEGLLGRSESRPNRVQLQHFWLNFNSAVGEARREEKTKQNKELFIICLDSSVAKESAH